MPANDLMPYNFSAPNPQPSYEGVIGALRNPVPSESSFLPEIQRILSQSSQFLQPSINALRENQNFTLADLQSAMGQRGLSGSSIEAQALGTQQGMNNQALASLLGSFSLNTALPFAQMDIGARQGDIGRSFALNQGLAGAAGQELASQRSMQMFREQLQAMLQQANRANEYGLYGAAINAAGQAGGAGIMTFA